MKVPDPARQCSRLHISFGADAVEVFDAAAVLGLRARRFVENMFVAATAVLLSENAAVIQRAFSPPYFENGTPPPSVRIV
jgi:hypothetical protein